MLIPRDITKNLVSDKSTYIQILIGPRQCGKSTLLAYLSGESFKILTLDDLHMRKLAEEDPALFLSQFPPPLIVDEVQYAPNLFPELKRFVDQLKQEQLLSGKGLSLNVCIRLTGSNQILLEKNVKESLVGRANYYYLNTLSVHEILKAKPNISIHHILYHGGYPELYINPELSVTRYLNDYIRNFIEKDIVLSAGIEKQTEFHTVVSMLAARTGNILEYSSIAKDSGVRSNTVKEWVSILQRTDLIYLLPPCESNLNKRLIKSPKIYFLDTGLAVRLQGWTDMAPLLNSPQIGSLFETLVLSEIVKCIRNFGFNWKLSVWRTKEEEIDFIIEIGDGTVLALDAKLGIHGLKSEKLPNSLKKAYPQLTDLILVSIGGERFRLSETCFQCPISELVDYLLEMTQSK